MTPMMAQWHACKEKAGSALLLFRLGDFYEAFFQDAETLSRELDVVLTQRQEIPMAGIPAHTSESYIDRLVAKGFKVAVAEQIESSQEAKGLVQRKIVRFITPGTVTNSSLLVDKEGNFVGALHQEKTLYGLALLDISTGSFRVWESLELRDLLDELERAAPKELLLPKGLSHITNSLSSSFEIKEEWIFQKERAVKQIQELFGVRSIEGLGLHSLGPALGASGALLHYVGEELLLPLKQIQSIRLETTSQFLAIDRSTQKHLELVTPLHPSSETLLSSLDETLTPMGGRTLRDWILHPLIDKGGIEERQNWIEALIPSLTELKPLLKPIRDLERILMRIETERASPRDLLALLVSTKPLPELSQKITPLGFPPLPSLASVEERLTKALSDSPPTRLSDGGVFKQGYHQELDELIALQQDSKSWMQTYQQSLRDETGIKTLKVGYTQAFGYYIEVGRARAEKVPDRFHRRQTLVNAERFITPELKEFEHKILSAADRITALEKELFFSLLKELSSQKKDIEACGKEIGRVDALVSLASVAKERSYTKPVITDSYDLEIIAGKHPVLEKKLRHQFSPNDLKLSQKEQLMILTGPNMAGKSTYLRQTALLVLLAQVGSFIPAKKATIGIVDKLFSRIGASDNLAKGESTFMVEMTETAYILSQATNRSLIILDEIGRGTSTYDGIAIASAVAEYLLQEDGKKAKTLFATHYAELCELEETLPSAVNYHVAVYEKGGEVTFLHKIMRGKIDRSYGIYVAKLAGLPQKVLQRAEELLQKAHHEQPKPKAKQRLSTTSPQLELFS